MENVLATPEAAKLEMGSRMTTTLLLWDIDGTLISAHGAGLEALRDALRTGLGVEDTLEAIELAGRTDRWIFRQILRHLGLPASDRLLKALETHYLAALPRRLEERGVHVLPGILSVLEQGARRQQVVQGLLTGNLRQGAELKLGHGGLWQHFPFGAFADDSENRNDLGPFAARRARQFCGAHIPSERIWVIGDTPHDVNCGRAAGFRTLAIATGRHSASELSAASPDATLENLADAAVFWNTVSA